MAAGGVAVVAYLADAVAGLDALPHLDRNRAQVVVSGDDALAGEGAVINADLHAVAAGPTDARHRAGRRGTNRGATRSGPVVTGVQLPAMQGGVEAHAEPGRAAPAGERLGQQRPGLDVDIGNRSRDHRLGLRLLLQRQGHLDRLDRQRVLDGDRARVVAGVTEETLASRSLLRHDRRGGNRRRSLRSGGGLGGFGALSDGWGYLGGRRSRHRFQGLVG